MVQSTLRQVDTGNWALTVRLGSELFALPLGLVDEVLPALPITRLAQCPAFLRGVVFVRDQLLPILDTARRLGMGDYIRPVEPYIVCLRVLDRLIGIEVDEAFDLLDLSSGTSIAASQVWANNECLTAVVELNGQVYRLLDPTKLLMAGDWEEIDTIHAAE